jgi:hypothetical protein
MHITQLKSVGLKQTCLSGLIFWTIITTLFASAPLLFAQNELSARGVVAAEDGQPISAVTVYSDKKCCPIQHEEAATNEEGEFRVEHPGTVIHFLKENLQPRTLVVGPRGSDIRVTMSPTSKGLKVPLCGPPEGSQKRFSRGKYGVQFNVPSHGVKIQAGLPDADYVRYVLTPKGGKSNLILWFGSFAWSPEPDDELFVNSTDFDQRSLVAPNGRLVGEDSWGHLRNGGIWRHTAIFGEGQANYRDASSEETSLFNRIIDSVCAVPYPGR